ncbi:MAG: LysR family transcriptional regulator [Geminicoccaceae bacterium]
MEMQQVRYFVALCETLNFTRAAERCNVSQPSLTRAIKLLEDELGGPLFHRERNNTHLTELGRRVEPHLRAAAANNEEARRQARAFASLSAPVLRLGLERRVALAPLADLLRRFAASFPAAEVALPVAPHEDLIEALRRGELEAAVVPRPDGEPDDFHYHPLLEDGVQLVLPESHRLAAEEAVALGQLAGETIVCVERCPYWDALQRSLEEAGVTLRPRLVVGRAQWFLDTVRSGLGIGLLSRHQPLGHGLVGRPLEMPPAMGSLALATKRGRLYSPPIRAFVELALAPRRLAGQLPA